MKIIKFKNELLTIVPNILGRLPLEEKQASARRRFLRSLTPFHEDLRDAREAIQKKYGTKDDKGGLKRVGEEQMVDFTPANKKKADVEWKTLNEEEIIIDVTPANERDVAMVNTILSEERAKFSELRKNMFSADDYDYIALIDEAVVAITPVEVKKKK